MLRWKEELLLLLLREEGEGEARCRKQGTILRPQRHYDPEVDKEVREKRVSSQNVYEPFMLGRMDGEATQRKGRLVE